MEDKQNVSEIISQEPIDHQSVSEVHIDFLYYKILSKHLWDMFYEAPRKWR